MSQRILKVNSVIHSALSKILVMRHAHKAFGIITVSKVQTSTDLKNCTVFVSSSDGHEDLTKYLNKIAPIVQKELTGEILLKRIPKIYFKYDDSGEYVARINSLINKVNKKD